LAKVTVLALSDEKLYCTSAATFRQLLEVVPMCGKKNVERRVFENLSVLDQGRRI
jgi:hypothetical protein